MAAEILIYGEIGETFSGDGVTAKSIAEILKGMASETEIRVRINSSGGDVFDGVAIYNLLLSHPATITVDIDGAAMSSASVIAMAGDTIRMAENALFMVHNPWTIALGNANEFRKMASILDTVRDNIAGTYWAQIEGSEEQILQWMDDETYFKAADAKAAGFVDEITGKGADPIDAKNRFHRLAALIRPQKIDSERFNNVVLAQKKLLLTKAKLGRRL